MKNLLALLKAPFARMLSSQKFWTTVVGIVVTWSGAWLARHGFDMSDKHVDEVAKYMAIGFGLLLAGQAAADHGKEAAKIAAATPTAPTQTQTTVVNEPASVVVTEPAP